MCGIAGIISRSGLSSQSICKMADIVRHRGPDDEGFYLLSHLFAEALVLGGKDTPKEVYHAQIPQKPDADICNSPETAITVALGHRRLSIVDLSPQGHQPLCREEKRFWIVYNGEVYNHIELRHELEKLGHTFLSHSDTEIILASYMEWGTECLSRFNGMFAFIIYDSLEQKIFVARDRFGIKPLYYWISPGGDVAFASEIKQFTVLPGWLASMNGQRVYDFLAWGISDHTCETMFANVYQLGGGEMLLIDVRKITDKKAAPLPRKQFSHARWYGLAPIPFHGTMEEAAVAFRDKLLDSVKLRLRADVPVGSCLSGGLDSSSIVCLMNRILEENGAMELQKTFSACSEVDKYDERKWIDAVVSVTEVDAKYVYPALSSLFDESSNITWHQDEPFGSTSIYAQWNVFRLASENGVKVMLDGQGADELLAGYHSFFGPLLATKLCSGHFFSFYREIGELKKKHGYSTLQSLENLANALLPEAVKSFLSRLLKRKTYNNPEWLNSEALACRHKNPLCSIESGSMKTVSEFSVALLTSLNLQALLHWEDRDSMGHSIESRVPFLDYRLVEFALGLPDEYKISYGITKRVLRQGMSGIIPDAISDRKDKLGFVTPEEVWLKEMAPDMFRSKLMEAVNVSGGILKREESLKMLEEMISGQRKFSFLPWRLISFGEWIKRFSVEV